MTEKRTFYHETEGGGIVFRTERTVGHVRIPNYVYDIWMPLLGAEAIGVYSVYCRLEMGGSVKKISQRSLATACRIGEVKLNEINTKLEWCGFIKVVKPTGAKRLMHWTTEIVVKDPPQKVWPELIKQLGLQKSGYKPLAPWLKAETPKDETPTSPETLGNVSGDVAAMSPRLNPLGLQTLVYEDKTPAQSAGTPAPEPAGNSDEVRLEILGINVLDTLVNLLPPLKPGERTVIDPGSAARGSPTHIIEIPVPHGTDIPDPASEILDIIITPYADHIMCPNCETQMPFDHRWKVRHPFRKDPHCPNCGTDFKILLEQDYGEDLVWDRRPTGAIKPLPSLGDAIPGWEAWLAGIIKGSQREEKDPLTREMFENWEKQTLRSQNQYRDVKEQWENDKDGFLRKLVWAWLEFHREHHFKKAEWVRKALSAYNTSRKDEEVDSKPRMPPGESYVPF
jgi:hypothetical protein